MEILRRRYEVKVWSWILTWVLILALTFGGIIGAVRYTSAQRNDAARDVALATYQANLASYQIAVSDRAGCIARATGRQDIGLLLTGIYDKIDVQKLDPTVNDLRGQLDKFVAEASTADCPPEPASPPVPPRLLNGG